MSCHLSTTHQTPVDGRDLFSLGRAVVGLLALCAGAGWASTANAREPPSIVLILADDLGYGDLGSYGATKVKTPHIDRIAREGIRFTDAHTPAAHCRPTRYGVLTGRYHWRLQERWVEWNREELLIDPSRTTIASLLKSAGYATAYVGKWHLGFGEGKLDWNKALKPGPLELGFDSYFGTPVSHNEPPKVLVENHRVVGLEPDDPIHVTEFEEGTRMVGGEAARFDERQLATAHTDKAVAFIERSHKKRPFFLFLATTNVHLPLTPHDRFRGSSEIGAYGDYIHELDWSVGRILDTLDRLGVADETLVIFTSDNGAMLLRDVMAAGHKENGSLLGQKTDLWEGGHRVPFLARWPKVIRPGMRSDSLICLTDLLATMAALAGVELDEEDGPDSLNILPALLGEDREKPVREALVVLNGRGWAVREGDWVLLSRPGSLGFTTEFIHGAWVNFEELNVAHSDYTDRGRLKPDAPQGQLYNLAADPGQTTNLYRQHPDRIARLTRLLDAIESDGRSRPPTNR